MKSICVGSKVEFAGYIGHVSKIFKKVPIRGSMKTLYAVTWSHAPKGKENGIPLPFRGESVKTQDVEGYDKGSLKLL